MFGVMDAYDYRNCQSLFGYAAKVHERSGGVCQLCGCGSGQLDFDLWRQLTVEHLIGESQGGYLAQIRRALAERFPGMRTTERETLASRIDAANTITACSFCNSTTSRDRARIGMKEAIDDAPDGPEDVVYESVTRDLALILGEKRRIVAWKLESVRAAFDELIAPKLNEVGR
jgi:hypothetical protein